MFCPNCGNDCGNAKFCVKCGTKIEQAEKEAAWSVGMPCPHCGGTRLDGNNCAFCGALLSPVVPQKSKRQFPDPPVGRYYYGNPNRGYVELDGNSITFYRAFLFDRKMGRRISFDDIFSVSFVPGKSMLNLGVLCVREWRDRYIPLTISALDGENDETCTYVSPAMNEDILRVYKFLSECAAINEENRTQNHE